MSSCSSKTILILLVLSALGAQAQNSLKSTDFVPVIGTWQGTLTYLDYTAKKTVVIPATLEIEQIKAGTYTFFHQFPKEPHVKWTDTLYLAKDGSGMGKEKLVARTQLADGSLQLVTEEEGKDDDQPALLRRTYLVAQDKYVLRKDVLPQGSNQWFNRHEYRYAIRAKYLTPQQMKADLALVKTTWEQIHPGLYRYNTPQQIDAYFRELDQKTNGVMEQRQFFILLSQLNIKLRCGHSFVSYYNNKRVLKQNLYSEVFLPLLFTTIERKLIVTHNLTDFSDIKLGEEITAINGIPSAVIIDSLLTVSKADGLNGMNKQLDNIGIDTREVYTDRYTLFDIFFPLFFKKDLNETQYTVTLKNGKGVRRQLTLQGMSKENRQAAFVAKYGDIPRDENSWYVKALTPQTALFRLGDFMTYKWKFNFNRFLDSVFADLNAKGYQNLIVDIRKNEGGADEARDAVLGYLTSKNLGCATPYRRLYRYNHVPDSLNKYLDTWDDDFRKPKPDALFNKTPEGFYESKKPYACTEINAQPHHFKGKIFLVTDVTNSSATFIMADVFKQNKLGTIVGETTGGTQQGINGGELFFLYLPHSKIEMDLPLIYQAPPMPRPDQGIQPDHLVKTTVRDFAQMKDPQVTYILTKLITAQKPRSGKSR